MRTLILPELTITDDLYEIAAAGVAEHAPILAPLTWSRLIDAALWTRVPNDRGEVSKMETTLLRSIELTVRLNVWLRPDLRRGDQPTPHNHPWTSFTGHVLGDQGGYSEDRYYVDERGDVQADIGVAHRSQAANTVDHHTYHEVTEIHAPGRTLSLMVCGTGRRGDWGYLDLATGEHRRFQPVAGFDTMLAALNMHQRAA